jgi:outer membrane protein
MKRLSVGVVAFLTAVSAAGAAAQSDTVAVRLSLNEAIDRAIKNSPEIVRAQNTIGTSEWSERAARGAFLPSLSFSSGAGLNSSNRFNPQTQTTVTGSGESYSAGLSAGMDLYTGGRRGAEMDRAKANTASAEAALVESRFNVVLQTKTAFFQVQRQGDLIIVAQGDVKRSEEALAAATRRLQVGSATRSDVLRAQLDLNNAKQSLLSAQTQERNASYSLGAMVGIRGPVGVRGDSLAIRPLPMTDAELVRLAEQNAPTVSVAEAAVTSARAGTSVAKASYLPTVRLSSGYDWSNPQARLDNWSDSRNLRLSLSYPLFNNFSREVNVASADANVRNAVATLAAAQRQVGADVQRALGDLRLAEQQVRLAVETIEVAREDLRVNQERYRLGMSTILDLLLSQNSLRSAEGQLVSTRYDYEIARAELEALVGRQL